MVAMALLAMMPQDWSAGSDVYNSQKKRLELNGLFGDAVSVGPESWGKCVYSPGWPGD